MAKWYPVVRPVRLEAGWGYQLGDGPARPFDDGKVKTPEQRLEEPDLQDSLAMPYRTGPIVPVTREEDDPGRIRFDPLFRATYGATAAEVEKALVPIRFLGQKLRVHPRAAPAFQRVAARLEPLLEKDATLRPYFKRLGGTFHWRKIAGTERQSAHSFGVSIDLDTAKAHYWEWQRPKMPVRWTNAIPQAVVDAFESEGFIWGGRWYHYDTMHFEYRPELLDPDCAQHPSP